MGTETFIAKTFAELEPFLYDELVALGAENCQILNRAVKFEGNIDMLYRANYFCRTALRILIQMDEFTFETNNQFYEKIFDFPAEKYLSYDGTLSISAQLSDTIFKTPLFASMLAKDAICDRFRNIYNERPSVDKDNPDVQFHIYVYQNKATIYLDSSGESLHKRGYKASNHPAPINEVVAAAIIKKSGWKGECDVIDFMCGSATLLIEAAMAALNIPAGFYRSNYGFYKWKNFDRTLWKKIRNEANILDNVNINFYGSDISARFLGMAKVNIEKARLEDFIKLEKKDLKNSYPLRTPALILLNPPYNERLEIEDINALYKEIGDTLKNNYSDCSAFIISYDAEAIKNIGLHAFTRKKIFNGELECRLMGYQMYKGKKWQDNSANPE